MNKQKDSSLQEKYFLWSCSSDKLNADKESLEILWRQLKNGQKRFYHSKDYFIKYSKHKIFLNCGLVETHVQINT